MQTFQAILSRRSVRKFKDQGIPNEIVSKMLEAARFAPSWANTQCWRFVVVMDREIRSKLVEALPAKNPGFSALLSAPVIVAALAEKSKSGYYKGEPVTRKGDRWYMFDVALALQNMVLAAWDNGIGSVYLGMFDDLMVKNILKIPDNFEVVTIVPFGFPEEQPKTPPRKDLKEIVFYDSYSEKVE